MKKNIKYWLAWIFMLPIAAIITSFAKFVLHWVLFAIMNVEENLYPRMPEEAIIPFICSIIFIFVISEIAPNHKLKVTIIFATIWSILNIVVIISTYEKSVEKLDLIYGIISVICSITGALVGYLWARLNISKHIAT